VRTIDRSESPLLDVFPSSSSIPSLVKSGGDANACVGGEHGSDEDLPRVGLCAMNMATLCIDSDRSSLGGISLLSVPVRAAMPSSYNTLLSI